MPTVQQLSHDMIEAYLKSIGWTYLRDSDGNFQVQFSYDDRIDCAMDLLLLIQGKDRSIYKLLVRSDKHIKRADWPRYMYLVNRWNSERRWPKAFLYIREPATSKRGEIMLECQINLGPGIHQELLVDFTNNAYFGSYEFWKWVLEEEQNSSGGGSE